MSSQDQRPSQIGVEATFSRHRVQELEGRDYLIDVA